MSNYFGLACATDGISFCVCEWKCVKRRGGSVSSPFSVQLSSSSARTFPARTIPPATQANFGLVLLLVKPTFVSTKSWIDFIFPRSHTFSHFIQLFWFLIFWLGCGWAGHGDYWASSRLFQSTTPLRATVLHGLGQRPWSLSETIKHRVLLPIKVLSYHLHSEDISSSGTSRNKWITIVARKLSALWGAKFAWAIPLKCFVSHRPTDPFYFFEK